MKTIRCWDKTAQKKSIDCALRQLLEETNLETVACQLPEQSPCSVVVSTDQVEPAGLGHMDRACDGKGALVDGGWAAAA